MAKDHVCNHCVIGEKTFKNILIELEKLQRLSSNGPQLDRSLKDESLRLYIKTYETVDAWKELKNCKNCIEEGHLSLIKKHEPWTVHGQGTLQWGILNGKDKQHKKWTLISILNLNRQ